jgi:hypothetical protein
MDGLTKSIFTLEDQPRADAVILACPESDSGVALAPQNDKLYKP